MSFALIQAHTALAPFETASQVFANSQTVVAVVEGPVLDSQRLYQPDQTAEGDCDNCDGCKTTKSAYTVELWTASWCSQCPAYKAKVQPALLKLGYKVVIKDFDKDSEELLDLRTVPAVCIHYKGESITVMIAPTVAKIEAFVKKHMDENPEEPKEPEEPELPPDLY